MKKEPLGLYIFRVIVGIVFVFFLLMLYWSSQLQEESLQKISSDISLLKEDMRSLKSDNNKLRQEMRNVIQNAGQLRDNAKTAANQYQNRPHIDPSLPNLLTEDPFYQKTLPELLGPDFKPHSTRHNATISKPDNLHPFSNWVDINTWQNLCIGSVSSLEFGKYETMAPDMAIKMEERKMKGTDIPEFWVHLREGVFWQPLDPALFPSQIKLAPHFLKKHPVTAHDFKFYIDAIMNPYVQEPGAVASRNYLGDIKEVEIVDDLTFIVRWKTEDVKQPDGTVVPKIKYIAKMMTASLKPLASFVYKYFADGTKIIDDEHDPNIYITNSVWAQNFAKHWAKNIIVSCGAFIFDGMTDRQISFKRNPDYYEPYGALVDRIEIQFKNTIESIWQDFRDLKLDSYSLQPSQLSELDSLMKSKPYLEQAQKGLAIKKLEYLQRSYYYIAWNEARPFFKSSKVRRALTMAIDRQRIINGNLNGMGVEIHGTFFINSNASDPDIKPWPYDPEEAKRMLAEEGWYDSTGTGIIDKEIDGKRVPFRFALTYFVKNPSSKSICEYVSTALKEIGIECQLNGVDVADLSAAFDDKNFDALHMAWGLGTPPEDPRQLWYSTGAKERGSSNMIGFANKEIDQIIDQLRFEYNPEKRIQLLHRFDRIMHEEQPYTFLFTPKMLFLYREYMQNVFIPADRQDLIPGADIEEPQPTIFWINRKE